jgi:hypothetical protein
MGEGSLTLTWNPQVSCRYGEAGGLPLQDYSVALPVQVAQCQASGEKPCSASGSSRWALVSPDRCLGGR